MSERLLDAPATEFAGPLRVFRKTIRRLREGLSAKQGAQGHMAQHEQRMARIRSLPPRVRELLRRSCVFLEADEIICFSMGISHDEFRRVLREASDYVLSHRQRQPPSEPAQTACRY